MVQQKIISQLLPQPKPINSQFRNNSSQQVSRILQQPKPILTPQIVSSKPIVVNSRFKTVKERINNYNKQSGQIIKKSPPVVTNLQADLTPSQIQTIKNLRGVGTGKYLAILGNGPSLADIDTTKLKNIESLYLCTINVPDERCWPTKYWAFYDRSQYHRHKERYRSFSGTIFNSTGIKEQHDHSIKFKNMSGVGFSHDPSKGIYIGMSSVYATIQIALYMSFNKIFVLGCDMNANVDIGRTHFYGVNPDVEPHERRKRFEKEANWYNYMAENVDIQTRNKIVFCSKDINIWPFMNSFHSVTPLETVDFIIKEIINAG